ncbi:MAG: hypothetical protein HQK77_15330 [Desulfobacterales bacterium]|nr:hypothetical protein [Desulfobacterales bacterium]
MALKYKMNEEGNAVHVNDKGFPIIIDESKNGEEIGIDAIHLFTKMPQIRNEAKEYRESRDKANTYLEKLTAKGIDPEKLEDWLESAMKALELTKNIEDKKLIEAGEVESIKQQATENLNSKIKELETSYKDSISKLNEKISKKDNVIFKLLISDKFSSSQFVKEKLNRTPKEAGRYFATNFKVEYDGDTPVVVGYFEDGRKIYSKERAGELADFDEALELLLERDDNKNSMLRGSAASGTGMTQGIEGVLSGNAIYLSKEQAKDPAVYKRLKEESVKTGRPLIFPQV